MNKSKCIISRNIFDLKGDIIVLCFYLVHTWEGPGLWNKEDCGLGSFLVVLGDEPFSEGHSAHRPMQVDQVVCPEVVYTFQGPHLHGGNRNPER